MGECVVVVSVWCADGIIGQLCLANCPPCLHGSDRKQGAAARHRGTVLTVGVAVVIAALFLAAQLVIMRHKRKEELARATGGYHFPVEINFPPEEP